MDLTKISLKLPESHTAARRLFADEPECIKLVFSARWPHDLAICPLCDDAENRRGQNIWLVGQQRWKCHSCSRQYSVKVGTPFEGSRLRLGTWLNLLWLMRRSKGILSSRGVARELNVSQKTALNMIRTAHTAISLNAVSAPTEVDPRLLRCGTANYEARRPNGGKRFATLASRHFTGAAEVWSLAVSNKQLLRRTNELIAEGRALESRLRLAWLS